MLRSETAELVHSKDGDKVRNVDTERSKKDHASTTSENETQELESDPIWESTLFDERAEDLDCDMCSVEGRTEAALIYCFDCEIYLCAMCHTFHGKLQTSRDHFCMHKNELQTDAAENEVTLETPIKDSVTRDSDSESVDTPRDNPGEHVPYRQEEVTVDQQSSCGPCVYNGRNKHADSICIDCLEYLCGDCKTSHLTLSCHKVVDTNDRDTAPIKQVVQVYDKPINKEFFERATPQKTSHQTMDRKFCHLNSFSPRLFQDLQYPHVTGLAITMEGHILVCDRSNERLKMFNPEFTPLSTLDIPDVAMVTITDKNTAVCTLPEKRKLAFIDIRANLKLLKFVDTVAKYWGVVYKYQELFALSMADRHSQASIHILDTTGHILSIIHPKCSLTSNLFLQHLKYLAISPSGGTLYITDSNDTVIALGLDGRVVFEYHMDDIIEAKGLVTDSKNVYVCSKGADCLVKVSQGGNESSIVIGHMNNLDSPCCIAMDTENRRMIISELYTSIIQVYQI